MKKKQTKNSEHTQYTHVRGRIGGEEMLVFWKILGTY